MPDEFVSLRHMEEEIQTQIARESTAAASHTTGKLVAWSSAGLFAVLTAVGALVKIPFPTGVPFTLQTLFVLLSGILLGRSYGALSQLLYLTVGLIGFPVFAHGGGPGYVLQPTFGYLLGYPCAAFIAGTVIHGNRRSGDLSARLQSIRALRKSRLVIAVIAGQLALFVPGVLYLYIATNFILDTSLPLSTAVIGGFLVFIPGDLIKMFAIVIFVEMLAQRLGVHVRRQSPE